MNEGRVALERCIAGLKNRRENERRQGFPKKVFFVSLAGMALCLLAAWIVQVVR